MLLKTTEVISSNKHYFLDAIIILGLLHVAYDFNVIF